MSNYIKITDFASKDALLPGDPNKIVKGTEIDDEFAELEAVIATKSDTVSPTFTGVPRVPTATTGVATTQVASTAFVENTLDVKVPVGTVLLMARTSVPVGFLEADGSAVSRAGYPDLFALVGVVYGVGDGTTTFNLPNVTAPADMGYFIRYQEVL